MLDDILIQVNESILNNVLCTSEQNKVVYNAKPTSPEPICNGHCRDKLAGFGLLNTSVSDSF